MRLLSTITITTTALIAGISACLPSGGGLFGGGAKAGGCGCATCPCGQQPAAAMAFAAPAQQVYYPQAPFHSPSAPLPLPPSPIVGASYQGHYLDRPQVVPLNPAFQGKAPLGFSIDTNSIEPAETSEDSATENSGLVGTIPNPFQYLEHVSVSHVPSNSVQNEKESYNSGPTEALLTNLPILTIPSGKQQQIEVEPSSAATAEDQYLPVMENIGAKNESKGLVTYYNQVCSGEKITTGEKETFNSASRKCQLLGCVAANAVPDGNGAYTVTYLKSAVSRTNKKGTYCLSSKELPAKSKRVIRRFDDMLASEESARVRRLLFQRRHRKH